MKVHRNIGQLPSFSNAVITIGTFDGVHQGHKTIIEALKNEAARIDGESILITFDPHPRKIVNPADGLQLIETLDEKMELLRQTGINHLVVVPFTREFASQSADEYIADFLVDKFHPHTIIIGYDHHFGKGRSGNFKLLEEKAPKYHYRLLEIPKYLIDESAVSSTKIRKALLESDVETANRLLGYDFFFSGTVIKGDQLGRQLGYPTANLHIADQDKIIPGHGVYAAFAEVDGVTRKGMLSIGNRPTLPDSDTRIEVNIFDFDEEIYGKSVRVTVKKYLRAQEKYDSLQELKEQLALDKQNSLRYL
jgi:riboflavin kinase / FMN adenylyltransferase